MAVISVVVVLAFVRLDYSRFGLTAGAIRQADLVAETLGVNVFRYKLTTFVLGSFVAGLAGVFFAHYRQVSALQRLRPGADGAARRLRGDRRHRQRVGTGRRHDRDDPRLRAPP
jgi:branched-subunit amino acid ABC-type transport system permease component